MKRNAVGNAALRSAMVRWQLPPLPNGLAIEGIVAKQVLLKLIEWANEDPPNGCGAVLSEQRFGLLVGNGVNRPRGPRTSRFILFASTRKVMRARDNPVLLVGIQIDEA